MTTATDTTKASGLGSAFAALSLAMACPLVVQLVAFVCARASVATIAVTPLAALGAISVFAFQVRFTRGALDAERTSATVIAAIALLIAVVGFLGSLAIALGLPAADGTFAPR